ncbi:MAG: DNA polymerase III subunit beta [Synergistaceae bacterium]|jgi:DNA polymerase-3 subunit beta|nr:DNA polymerase III subunit beta [Synergistaceae bacterium]
MKIEIFRPDFFKAWQMAERTCGTKSTMPALSGILLTVMEQIGPEGRPSSKAELSATDLRTSIRCSAQGVDVSEAGSVILPVKLLGELFKKAPSDRLSVDVRDEKGTFIAGRSRTRFSTWPVGDFPKLPKGDDAEFLCDVSAGDLMRLLTEGSVASSPTDDFPKYMGACLLQLKDGKFRVASTDSRRLSLSRRPIEAGALNAGVPGAGVSDTGAPDTDAPDAGPVDRSVELLLPVAPIRELQRLLGNLVSAPDGAEIPVSIFYDGSMAWFRMKGIEFSIRRVESSFPNYEKLLNPNSTTTAIVNRLDFIAALERVDIVVRGHSRLAVMQFSPGGQIKLSGRAPETGVTMEELDASIDGEPLRAGFNVTYLVDGLKSLDSETVKMNLNGGEGQMILNRESGDDFLYMLMPVRVDEQDVVDPEEDFSPPRVVDPGPIKGDSQGLDVTGVVDPEPIKGDSQGPQALERGSGQGPEH